VAEYLRTVADRLDSGEEFTLEAGIDSVTLTPPSRIDFKI
jgi:amphi-Trp domain-containing protein